MDFLYELFLLFFHLNRNFSHSTSTNTMACVFVSFLLQNFDGFLFNCSLVDSHNSFFTKLEDFLLSKFSFSHELNSSDSPG